MTVDVVGNRPDVAGGTGVRQRATTTPERHRLRTGRMLDVRVGQVVSSQAAVALTVFGALRGTLTLIVTALLAAALLAATWLRLRRRWAFELLPTALRYASRRHAVDLGGEPGRLLQLVAAGTHLESAELAGDQAAVVVDDAGVTAVAELGDPTGLLVEPLPALPHPASLLPPAGTEHPPCRIQLVLTGVPAPAVRAGSGTPGNSYRQLTEGRLLGHSRALLAVRVLRAEGWSEHDLRRTLSGLLRRLSRRLDGIPVRPLGEAAVLRALAEIAHHTGDQPASESWTGLCLGGLTQTTFRLHRWPDPHVETARRVVSRMLALPAAATTVAVSAGPRPSGRPDGVPVDLTVRLAAADSHTLELATQALHRLLASEQARAHRLDGEHLSGLAATLPLGGSPTAEVPGRPVAGVLPAGALDGLELPVGNAGIMLGTNRHGAPVVSRLFRPEQTRAVLIGGVRAAQLVALRAMALGARVVVQTARPQVWEPFARGAAVPGESIIVVPPGRVLEIPPGTALYPLLLVVDIGPVGPDGRVGPGWQATLVVRDELSPADVDLAARADLLLLQPLRPAEAAVAASGLGLGEVAHWLTRIRADMIGVVNRRAVRWAALSTTPIEAQLIGTPARD